MIFCPSILGIRRVFSLSIKTSALGLLLLLAAGASALLTMRSVLETQQVEVPSLLGRPVPEAGAMASKRGLLVRVEGKRNDPRIPPDHIVAQAYLPEALEGRRFYTPTDIANERTIRERLAWWQARLRDRKA